MSRSAPSTQPGTSGPPNEIAPGRVRVAAQAEPLRAGDQLGARQRAGVGAAHQVGGELARRPVADRRGLDADRERVDPVAGRRCAARASCAAAWARLRPPAVVASVTVTTRTGRSRRGREIGRRARTHAASVRMPSVIPACSSSTRCHAAAVRRRARPTRLRERDDDRVDRTADAARARTRELRRPAAREAGAVGCRASMPTHSTPRAASASAIARAQRGVVGDDDGTTAHGRGAARPVRPRRTRCRDAGCRRRCSPARPRPARARPGRATSRRRGSDATSAVRATSSRRGGDDPRHLGAVREHDLPVAPRRSRRWRGRRRPARGARAAASTPSEDTPPVAESRPVGCRRRPGAAARRAPCGSRRSATAR